MQHTERAVCAGLFRGVPPPRPVAAVSPSPDVLCRELPCLTTSSLQNLQQLDYRWWLTGSTESADVAVPLILEATNAQSVADVGCGLGQWLAAFKRLGVEDVLGYDGPGSTARSSSSRRRSSSAPI